MRFAPPIASALRWVGLLLIAAIVVVAGTVLGWRLAGPTNVETAIGRVSLELEPSLTGDATAFIPVADWGFRADAFDAPFELRAELRSLQRPALTRAAEGDLSVLSSSEAALRDGATDVVVRGLGWALGSTLVLAAALTLIWRRVRPRWALAALAIGLALAGAAATALAARSSFDGDAFRTPTYFARGAELQRILDVVGDERVGSEYGSTLASILRSVGAVLTEAPTDAVATRDLYLASDLHANPLVIDPLARSIDGAPLILAGDFGQRGGQAEAAALAPRVAALGARVIAVSGNHDTSLLMAELDGDGVTVLGSPADEPSPSETTVRGLRVAGYPDPLEWPGPGDPPERPITFDDLPDPERAALRAEQRLIEWFDVLPARPDVVVVHQDALAQALAAELAGRGAQRELTILTGHDHRQHIDRYGPIAVVDAGSVGAGGVFDAGRQSIGLARLHFSSAAPTLRSVDLLSIEPFSGQAQATRVVIDELCPGEPRCRIEPSPPAASPPAE